MRFLLVLLASLAGWPAFADDQPIKPYVLAGDVAAVSTERVADDVRRRLAGAGYEVLGSYSPFPDAQVIAITNRELKAAASPSLSAFAAVVHVAVTRVGERVQTSYLNPRYLAAAYHAGGSLDAIARDLDRVLGHVEDFGADQGRTAAQLAGYRYLLGMERFEDTYELARHASQAEAVKAIEQNLSARLGGSSRVYRLDLPGERVVYGIGLAAAEDQRVNDRHVLAEVVDAAASRKTTAYLPYQILVENGRVSALHMRFRMAVWHPDLTMLTFGKLVTSPGAFNSFLRRIAGGGT